jgi:hypothetical protein
MVRLNRKFSAPPTVDIQQWKKVQLLVARGFLFQPIHDGTEARARVGYPKTLRQAKEFVVAFAAQAAKSAR